MKNFHDPHRQISYLQQVLSSDKRPLGFFLGAGCPMSIRTDDDAPLIPDIAGITKKVREKLQADKSLSPLLGKLDEQFATDEVNEPNVEQFLSHIRSLRAVAGKDQVRGLDADELEKLDRSICDLIQSVVDRNHPSPSSPYHFLASWINAISREDPVELFTTNYDLLMEQALEDSKTPFFDGFSGVRQPFFDLQGMEEDKLPPRWARLWKLHGSTNWYQTKTGVVRSVQRPDDSSNRLIHPSHLKYDESRRMPYLAMLDRVKTFLKRPTSTLIICGYSFGDEHLNEILLQGLLGSPSSVCFALLFGDLEKHETAIKLATSRPNISLLARNGGVISGLRGKWPQRPTKEQLPEPGNWLSWEPIDPQSPEAEQAMRFTLGNFFAMGQFLQTLLGKPDNLPQATPDAE